MAAVRWRIRCISLFATRKNSRWSKAVLNCQGPNAPKRCHFACYRAAARSPEIACARSQSSPAEAGKRIHLGDVSTVKQGSQLFRLFLR
jgi:hypothetical protein